MEFIIFMSPNQHTPDIPQATHPQPKFTTSTAESRDEASVICISPIKGKAVTSRTRNALECLAKFKVRQLVDSCKNKAIASLFKLLLRSFNMQKLHVAHVRSF